MTSADNFPIKSLYKRKMEDPMLGPRENAVEDPTNADATKTNGEHAAVPAPVPTATATKSETSNVPTSIVLRSPEKYNPTLPSSTEFKPPPLEWLEGTWTVTHSTLPMWRKAKNVRITYKIIPPSKEGGTICLYDVVTSEPIKKGLMPNMAGCVKGVDTPASTVGKKRVGAWDWRGRGWLKIASSHWEVLGWGEKDGEKWVVTWFAPSLFTPAGLDVYCDRREGISEELFKEVQGALEGLEAREMADLCRTDMRAVVID